MLLIVAGFVLFLLGFSLEAYESKGYRSALCISFWVVGGICIILFGLYEKFWSPKSFIPFELLTDRTVMSACSLAAFLFISF
jgi:hypothetical protein